MDVGSDVICLQEVYRTDHKEFFKEALRDVYPHVIHDPKSYLMGYDSGLLIFSKAPFLTEAMKRFSTQPIEERLFSKKAALACTVELEGLRVGIVNAHATNIGFNFKQDDQRVERIRRKQIEDVIDLSQDIRSRDNCNIVLVSGDYNCGPQVSPDNYAVFAHYGYMDTYSMPVEELTWDPSENVLIKAAPVYRNQPGQRVDLVLSDPTITTHYDHVETTILFKEHFVDIDETTNVPLSDHYGVLTTLRRRDTTAP